MIISCLILGGALAATFSASTATAVVGGVAAVTTVTAIGLKKYSENNEIENRAACERAKKRYSAQLNEYKANIDRTVQEHNKESVEALLRSLETSNLTEEEKQYCREYVESKVCKQITR